MITWIKKIAINKAKKVFIAKIEKNKYNIIEDINKKVDLPKLNEEQERKVFLDFYNLVLYIVKAYLKLDEEK